jgi:hypothetical protein
MQSAMAMRGASFMSQWIQDNIARKCYLEWDLALVCDMKRMCLAEADARGIVLDELECAVGCELEGLILTALEQAQSNELHYLGVSGMLSAALH